jgi:hypothetical protein
MRKGGLESDINSRKAERIWALGPSRNAIDAHELSPRGTISEALIVDSPRVVRDRVELGVVDGSSRRGHTGWRGL